MRGFDFEFGYIRWKASFVVRGEEKGFDKKFYYFKEAKTPQAMGYKDVGKMQDIVEEDSPKLREKLGIQPILVK